jgi:TRAP-type uncharacterized transport system fused permease subunit
LYIIPLLFCYTPILFEGPLWQVIETAVLGLGGLYCFAVFFEGYNQRMLNWPARFLYLACAAAMLWPDMRLHAVGAAVFLTGSALELTVFRPVQPAVAIQKE